MESYELIKTKIKTRRTGRIISIVPNGYDLKKRIQENTNYCKQLLRNVEWVSKILELHIKEAAVYKDISFLK